MILSQLKEEQTARGIVTFTLAVRINIASDLFEHACMILRRLCKSCFYVWKMVGGDCWCALYLNNFWFSISAWKPSCAGGLPA